MGPKLHYFYYYYCCSCYCYKKQWTARKKEAIFNFKKLTSVDFQNCSAQELNMFLFMSIQRVRTKRGKSPSTNLASSMDDNFWSTRLVMWPIRVLCWSCWSARQMANLDRDDNGSLQICRKDHFKVNSSRQELWRHYKEKKNTHLSNLNQASEINCWTSESWGSTFSLEKQLNSMLHFHRLYIYSYFRTSGSFHAPEKTIQ